MKKETLKEWRTFLVKESKRGGMDDMLDVPENIYRWFETFSRSMGIIQHIPEMSTEWQAYLKKNYPSWEAMVEKTSETKKQAESTKRHILGGHSYYAMKLFGPKAVEKLYNIKIKHYIDEAPQAHKEFFFSNMDSVLEQGMSMQKTSRVSPVPIGFAGQMDDWFMFGQGFDIAETVFKEQQAQHPELVKEPSVQEPEQEQTPTEEKPQDKQQDMADFFNKFFNK